MKTKCPSETCQCNADPKPKVWKCDISDVWIYTQLPENMRPAVKSDFFYNKSPIYGKKYLAQSFLDNTYQAYKLSANTSLFDLSYFITANRVFIQNN